MVHQSHQIHSFFFLNATPNTEIYTLSLHDALPICTWNIFKFNVTNDMNVSYCPDRPLIGTSNDKVVISVNIVPPDEDRKSTRLNSSHSSISYAVFCLKKKKWKKTERANWVHLEEVC